VDLPDSYEKKLIERLQRRDEAAFNEFVRLFQGRVFSIAVRMLGDRGEAEDVAQEVFVAIFKAMHTFRGESKLSTWVLRIATNHTRNRLKYLGRRARGSHDELEALSERTDLQDAIATTSTIRRPDTLSEEKALKHLVEQALERLEPEQREILVLRDVEDLAYEEIQQITGLAEGTVKSRLHRARLALKVAVERLQGSKR
jgi:RNA polymerase sigma-70 factor (ECF subfamily)